MAIIAFLGLGNMGYPLAGHLAKAGHHLQVYNRTFAKAEQWVNEYSGQVFTHPSSAVANADYVFMCLGRDDDVRQVLIQQQTWMQIKTNALVVDHTTTSALLAEEIANLCHTRHVRFADAPVSGGQQGAQNGQLSIMLGCQEQDFQELKEIMAPYTKAIERMGGIGAGQKTKMVNQICVAGLIQALAEGLNFAQNAGLDAKQVMQVVGAGAASSWQLLNRHQSMLDGHYEHGFAVDWMRKDLQICLQEAAHNGSSLPITALVDQFYGELQKQQKGKLDTSALLLRLQK
ncbi:MAG: NAD(P)-dependent oxidoreductase [Venatoribacter sp.]